MAIQAKKEGRSINFVSDRTGQVYTRGQEFLNLRSLQRDISMYRNFSANFLTS